MLNVHNLTISFSGEELFENISFRLNAGDRVGLIGKNGAGKSTMLKILARDLKPDTGTVTLEKEMGLGFLRQDIDFVAGRTVKDEVYQAFEEIKALESRLAFINTELTERTDYESQGYNDLMVQLSDTMHRFEQIGGYSYEGSAEKVLLGLGFEREDFDRQTDTFSGGWRMRIELAKLLLQNNGVLLLDEPTNHLDIESIIWLEQFLKTYWGAVVIVSHDKMFLDNVTNRTIEIVLGKIYDYNKPYSQFLVLRSDIREKQLASQKNQEKQIQQTEKLIEKFRAKASKASMAQSLIKKIDKIERIEVDDQDNSIMSVRFPISVQPGKLIMEIEGVSKAYGDKTILENINLIISRGAKIAFVGKNGQGKSTLAKIIVGELEHTGSLRLGHNVQIGYFAQNQAEYLDASMTLLETMQHAANESNRSRVRDILGAFLFRGDEVDKKVKVLSGGERNRLALAKMLLQPFNVLVMDEPTNHLDIQSKNVLKIALQNFEGTMILVSHDRDFLQGLASDVYEFKNHAVKEYPGDINYYLEQRSIANLRDLERKDPKKQQADTTKPQSKQDKSAKNKINSIEAKIAELESGISDIESSLNTKNPDEATLGVYKNKKRELEKLMAEWEVLHSKH